MGGRLSRLKMKPARKALPTQILLMPAVVCRNSMVILFENILEVNGMMK